MYRVIKASLTFVILLTVFVVYPPANYLPYIPVLVSQAYADSPESWSLKNGTLLALKGYAGLLGPAAFQGMVINITNGVVNSTHTIPVNYKSGTFDGIVKFTLQGTYSGSSGMSGQYTMYIDGTLTGGQRNKEPFQTAFTGPFSGPGGISDGKTVTVAFGEAICPPIPGCGDENQKSSPFDVSFTATTGKSAALPATPGTGSKQLPSVNKGDYNGDGRVTELDALAALKMSVKLLTEELKLDLDANGKVTAADARLILKKALGK